jgi:hypothetical protein
MMTSPTSNLAKSNILSLYGIITDLNIDEHGFDCRYFLDSVFSKIASLVHHFLQLEICQSEAIKAEIATLDLRLFSMNVKKIT